MRPIRLRSPPAPAGTKSVPQKLFGLPLLGPCGTHSIYTRPRPGRKGESEVFFDRPMRLVTFAPLGPGGRPRPGALLGPGPGDVVDLRAARRALLRLRGEPAAEAVRRAAREVPSTVEALIRRGPEALAAAREALALAGEATASDLDAAAGAPVLLPAAGVRLLAPISRPNSLRDFLAFEDHARAGAARRGEELAAAWYDRPLYYKGNHRSIVGPGELVPRPAFTREMDFELEVACIVGAGGLDLSAEESAARIAGFTVMNDWSARDVQRAEMSGRLGPAKSKDFATSLGPCIVTADEAGGPHPDLHMTARVNGEVVCEGRLGAARWTFPQMIAHVSRGERVWPTDVYGSGTPLGGCQLDRGSRWLEPGDTVELEVERIGVLRNVVG